MRVLARTRPTTTSTAEATHATHQRAPPSSRAAQRSGGGVCARAAENRLLWTWMPYYQFCLAGSVQTALTHAARLHASCRCPNSAALNIFFCSDPAATEEFHPLTLVHVLWSYSWKEMLTLRKRMSCQLERRRQTFGQINQNILLEWTLFI